MNRAESEQRALKRELLLARAAAERAQIVDQIDSLDLRTRSTREILGFALNGADQMRTSPALSTATTVVRFVRRQPWLVPIVVKGVSKLARSGPLPLGLVVGALALGVWWISRPRDSTATVATEDSTND